MVHILRYLANGLDDRSRRFLPEWPHMSIPEARRPLASRSTRWAAILASGSVRAGLTADGISMLSLVFAAAGAAALLWLPAPWNLAGCAAGIQLRLLCNLLDGMVAIEGGRKSKVGALYNEVPDRVADTLFIVALGYAIATPWLGWLGALAAAVTAYIRVLGGTFGLAQDFRGPMAKQHRMAVMTLGCLLGIFEFYLFDDRGFDPEGTAGLRVLRLAAWVIAIGGIVTCGTRVHAIARQLKAG
jgi:phosphatidylglycerophosphate synthase